MEFQKLESLRLLLAQIQRDHVSSLRYFAFEQGFRHISSKPKISVSSTATCVMSLVSTGNWIHDESDTKILLEYLLSKTTSAGLPDGNAFTMAWILEAITSLTPLAKPLKKADQKKIKFIENRLRQSLRTGSVKIESYPPSAYLTQLVVRSLKRRSKLTPTLEGRVGRWAWDELSRQLVLIQAKSKTADAFAVAYLIMLVTTATPGSDLTPEQAQIRRDALETFFQCQLTDGTWPLSRPLFHYQEFGNAYCYEYEMLTQLLLAPGLQEALLDFLPRLGDAAMALENSAYEINPGIRAWSSGHHPQLPGPESWTTASVYHFTYALNRLLAEAVRRELYRYLEVPVPRPIVGGRSRSDFATTFLDSNVRVKKKTHPLKKYIWDHFVAPLSQADGRVRNGHRLGKDTPRSAIFFGPPGTSKTELAKHIADFLGWPLLAIDPSHLLRHGMDGIQVEANAIFRMLGETERVVVLFDEFDEMVREREGSDGQPFSRLLTTAMLPKLANIHRGATLVFIIATNSIREFDLAIRRPGRFDRILQVMPPTYKSKTAKKDWGGSRDVDFESKLRKPHLPVDNETKKQLAALTFGECEGLASELATHHSTAAAATLLARYYQDCILMSPVKKGDKTTWLDRCKADEELNR